MTDPNFVNAGEKATVLNYVLRVLDADGQLYEIDGNEHSIGLYSAEMRGWTIWTSREPAIAAR